MLKAVLFDLDDTLLDWSQRSQNWVDYERQHLTLVLDYINREIQPVSTADLFFDTVRQLSRQGWLAAERGLRPPVFSSLLLEALGKVGIPAERVDIEACLRAYDAQLVGGVCPFPDAEEILPLLVANNLKLGVITNAAIPMWMRDHELDMCGLLPYFADCRFTAADVGYLKPHPVAFETALSKLGLQPDEAIFVGDNPEADIAGAQNVGMKAVLRINRKTPPLISGLIIPDAAINTLHELLPVLDEWYPDWRPAA